jgi:hypothetical protein
MSRRIVVASIVLAMLSLVAAPAAAQPASPGAFEIAIGGLWMNHSPLTSGDATETTPGGTAFRLFATSTTLGTLTGAELLVGVHIGRHFEVFGAGSFGARQLRINVTDDAENGPSVTASERLEQYLFTGGVLWAFTQSRLAPFISAEAGQLRQLHEEKTLVETGLVYMAGGGLNIQFTDPRGDIGVGVRVHARAMLRSNQFLIDTERVTPAANVSLFVRF